VSAPTSRDAPVCEGVPEARWTRVPGCARRWEAVRGGGGRPGEERAGAELRARAMITAKAGLTIDQVNYLNVGLMIASAAIDFRWPFETFLFAYIVLGPLHSLTEIS
jgi:hypothetical protein